MDRRQFSLLVLAAGLSAGVSACGRRGPLEPPPYTAQGQEWARRSGRNQPAQPGAAAQGSVRDAVAQDEMRSAARSMSKARSIATASEGRSAGPERFRRNPRPLAPLSGTQNISPTGTRRRPPGIVPPKRSFILDPLLE